LRRVGCVEHVLTPRFRPHSSANRGFAVRFGWAPANVQDYYCELTNVQTELYTAFSQWVMKGALGSSDKSESTSAFKILSYLREFFAKF
jgi:hypothetical protein